MKVDPSGARIVMIEEGAGVPLDGSMLIMSAIEWDARAQWIERQFYRFMPGEHDWWGYLRLVAERWEARRNRCPWVDEPQSSPCSYCGTLHRRRWVRAVRS